MRKEMQAELLYPLFAMVALTFAVAFWMGGLRFAAVRRREVSMRYFRLNAGEIPDRPAQAANNFRNLLEIPVLFYALAALLLATGSADSVQVTLAWIFVASRYLHSAIHLSYNHVPHRFLAFLAGVLVLLVMWVRFALQMTAG
jgi:hypothetical protein